tara:strand:- start:16755 stop:17045 length:291 start_codon:yes stop_codon:yes gene_type:complete
MKKYFSILVLFGFISNAFADDWRMRKFDLDQDGFIKRSELMAVGCNYKVVKLEKGLFNYADKNDDGLLDKKEARSASDYIFRSNCPKHPKPVSIRG